MLYQREGKVCLIYKPMQSISIDPRLDQHLLGYEHMYAKQQLTLVLHWLSLQEALQSLILLSQPCSTDMICTAGQLIQILESG